MSRALPATTSTPRNPRDLSLIHIFEREVELRGARVALAAGAAAELVVDTAGLVALGADDGKAARGAHLLALLGALRARLLAQAAVLAHDRREHLGLHLDVALGQRLDAEALGLALLQDALHELGFDAEVEGQQLVSLIHI